MMADDTEEPLFMRAAKTEAKRRGIPVEQVLAEDFEYVRNPGFTKECLTPEEARAIIALENGKDREGWISDEHLKEVQSHIKNCALCQLFLSCMRPHYSRTDRGQ